eukprot:1185538-Prorocentrum_minimum.AAC.3
MSRPKFDRLRRFHDASCPSSRLLPPFTALPPLTSAPTPLLRPTGRCSAGAPSSRWPPRSPREAPARRRPRTRR